ncbi:MAG: cation transporter [Elusimicrobia bacterium]|jgi:cobalt-zinc-cadmium efflux system protein|nr:cation transporter [Elusimicrobiota bacterium]MBK7544354.1 cation transporter [Elusimicrobiota bacterium]MBK7573876.1 cation transporter [Elusimicrobiota bacterium]MBK7689474.1 cation transporter [Elusimicrobiota bacterium]MBK8126019.1 cation transporter [Elusimicrobiota bacterium]
MNPHSHTHRDTDRRPRAALAFAVTLTGLVFVAELWGGLRSGSLALLSDAGHMLMDFLGLVITLVALRLSARPASDRRTFGWHRVEVLAAAVNGLLVSALAGGLLWESALRLRQPVLPRLPPMIGVAVLGLVANLWVAARLRGAARHDLNLRGAFLHVTSDALASVGVIGAGLVMAATGWAVLDPLIGIGIAGAILFNAFRLLREALNLLLEGVPRHLRLDEVLAAVKAVPGVVDLSDAHLWGLCSHMVSLSAHITVDPARWDDQPRLQNEIAARLRDRFGIGHVTLQMENRAWTRP